MSNFLWFRNADTHFHKVPVFCYNIVWKTEGIKGFGQMPKDSSIIIHKIQLWSYNGSSHAVIDFFFFLLHLLHLQILDVYVYM